MYHQKFNLLPRILLRVVQVFLILTSLSLSNLVILTTLRNRFHQINRLVPKVRNCRPFLRQLHRLSSLCCSCSLVNCLSKNSILIKFNNSIELYNRLSFKTTIYFDSNISL